MAIEKKINIQVTNNIDNSIEQLSSLKKEINGAKNATVDLSNQGNSLSKLQGGIDAVGNAVSGLNPAFGAAVKGSNSLILKMWEMVANPVGAILAGIVITCKFLYEAFQSSVAGGKELKAIFAAVSAIGTQVKDALFGLGRALIDVYTAAYKFLTLDFKGGMESIKKANKEATESYKQLGNAVDGTTAKIIYNLEKQQQSNDKARKIQAVVQSETNKLLVQSREILTDETASLKDKKKALEEVTKAEMASSKEKVRIAAEDLRIAKEKAKAMGGEEEKKAKQELRELTIALNEAETENAQTGIKLNKQKKMLSRQEAADQKEALDAEKQRLKEIAETNKKQLEERKKQIEEARKAEEDRRKSELDLEKKYRDDLLNLNTKSEEEKLDLQAQRDLEEINRIAKTANEKSNLMALYNEKYNTLYQELDDKQKAINEKAIADKKAKDEKDLQDKSAKLLEIANNEKLSSDARLQAIADREAIEKNIIFKSQEEKTAFEKQNSEARIKIADLEKQHKIKALEETSNTLNGLADLLGKQTTAGKAAAVASATISTFLSAQKAYDATVGIPYVGPFIAPINAGLAIASGLKNVKSILSVQTPGGSGGGGSIATPSAGGGAIASAPAPNFNVVGSSGTNQLAQAIGSQTQKPIEAYVVASNVSSAQAMNRNIVTSATIG